MSTFLQDSLEAYLKSLGTELTDAETPHVAALRLMARTLDAQEEPGSNLLSAYARELARFQKGRATTNKPKTDLGKALADLEDADGQDHD